MKHISLLFLILLWIGCADQDHAGGSGMEIPNAITVKVTHENGSPVIGEMARIVADGSWMRRVQQGEPVILDSMRTDSTGEISYTPTEDEAIRLEIILQDEGISVACDSTLTTVALAPLGSIQATWTPGGVARIKGTTFSQQADSNGQLTFRSVPYIRSGIIGQEESSAPVILSTVELASGIDVDLGLLQAWTDSLVLDDFDMGIPSTRIDPIVQRSYWFSVADEQNGGGSTIYPSTAKFESWQLATTDSMAASGKSLTIHYQLSYALTDNSYTLFGCTMGTGIESSALDSISFLVHANGGYLLSTVNQTLYQGLASNTDGWERVSISKDKLDSLALLPRITLLQFVFTDTTGSVFRLDDFTLYGDPYELLTNYP